MNKLTGMVALWTVVMAVLFVLLSPLTPGAIAPQGGKLLKPIVVFALNTFIAKLLLFSVAALAIVFMRKTDDVPASPRALPISLRC